MKRQWLTVSLGLALGMSTLPLSAAGAAAGAAPAYTLTLSEEHPSRGDSIEVVVTGHNLQDVYAYEVNLQYDAARLKLKEAKSEIPGFSVSPIMKSRSIQLAHTRIGKVKGDSGDVTLYKMTFETLSQGKAEIALQSIKLVDSNLVSSSQSSEEKVTAAIGKPAKPQVFADLGSFEWAKEAIDALADRGVVEGTSDTTFSPAAPVTRADFVVLLARALQLDGEAGPRFDDVEPGSYYEQPVALARKLGIVEGDDENAFRPRAAVTREDMMAITARALRVVNKLPAADLADAAALESFADSAEISDYAVGSVSLLAAAGLVHGYDGGIHPKETTNRAQAAVLIYNLLKYTERQ